MGQLYKVCTITFVCCGRSPLHSFFIFKPTGKVHHLSKKNIENWLSYDVFGFVAFGDLSFFLESALPFVFLPATLTCTAQDKIISLNTLSKYWVAN